MQVGGMRDVGTKSAGYVPTRHCAMWANDTTGELPSILLYPADDPSRGSTMADVTMSEAAPKLKIEHLFFDVIRTSDCLEMV